MAAPETAGARTGWRHLKLSGTAKLGVRIIISAALLALLITKIPADDIQPKDTHTGTLAFLAAGLAFTLVGFVLSAWRWQRVLRGVRHPRAAAHAARPLPGRAVRGERAPVDHRGRRPADQSGRQDHRCRRRGLRVGGHRATEWLRRAPVALVPRASHSSRRCSGSTTRGSRSPSPAPRSLPSW